MRLERYCYYFSDSVPQWDGNSGLLGYIYMFFKILGMPNLLEDLSFLGDEKYYLELPVAYCTGTWHIPPSGLIPIRVKVTEPKGTPFTVADLSHNHKHP